ncbi:MAG: TolC family protein [bacterium]
MFQKMKLATLSYVYLLSFGALAAGQNGQELSLDQAVSAAQQQDPWIVSSQYKQSALLSGSIAAGELPDPKVSVGLLNLPLDTFDFGQEPMTQFKVGVSQMFPRGDSLKIKKRQLQLKAAKQPYQREDRLAKVAVNVSQVWLNAYLAQESILLIEKDRPLFIQLGGVAEASYASALGKTRQQDIIRAQLELTRLDDRLTRLQQKKDKSYQKLSQWISGFALDQYMQGSESTFDMDGKFHLSHQLPELKIAEQKFLSGAFSDDELYKYLSQHPMVKALDTEIAVSKAGVELAQQKYKPQWGVNSSYAYRGESPIGNDRADFFSIGVSIDVPLFTKNKQDKQLDSAVALSAAIETKKWLLVRQMLAALKAERAGLKRLNDRQKLYEKTLIPQIKEQAEASLQAYTNDDGDFAEVVRARIAALNAELDALKIDVEIQQIISRINYYFVHSTSHAAINNRGE